MVSEISQFYENALILSIQREDAFKHFRWTPRTSRVAIVGFIVIPGALFYYSNSTFVRLSVFSPIEINLKLACQKI